MKTFTPSNLANPMKNALLQAEQSLTMAAASVALTAIYLIQTVLF